MLAFLVTLEGLANDAWTFFTTTKIGRALGLALILIAALFLYTAWVKHTTTVAVTDHVTTQVTQKVTTAVTAQVVGQVQTATATEAARREVALAAAQALTKTQATALVNLKAQNAQLLKEIDNASHAADSRGCLDADSVRRLDALK